MEKLSEKLFHLPASHNSIFKSVTCFYLTLFAVICYHPIILSHQTKLKTLFFRRKRTLSEENENLNPVSLNKRPRYLSLQFKLFAIQLEFEKSSYILTTGLRGTWRGSQRTFPHSPLLPPLQPETSPPPWAWGGTSRRRRRS